MDEALYRQGEIKILAYFTLSYKALLLSEKTSKTIRRKITGGHTSENAVPVILIGHLGKYIRKISAGHYEQAAIKMDAILDEAFANILESHAIIPSRITLVECADIPQIRRLYESYGFKYYAFHPQRCLHQYYLRNTALSV